MWCAVCFGLCYVVSPPSSLCVLDGQCDIGLFKGFFQQLGDSQLLQVTKRTRIGAYVHTQRLIYCIVPTVAAASAHRGQQTVRLGRLDSSCKHFHMCTMVPCFFPRIFGVAFLCGGRFPTRGCLRPSLDWVCEDQMLVRDSLKLIACLNRLTTGQLSLHVRSSPPPLADTIVSIPSIANMLTGFAAASDRFQRQQLVGRLCVRGLVVVTKPRLNAEHTGPAICCFTTTITRRRVCRQ